jgi:hypothetical protein
MVLGDGQRRQWAVVGSRLSSAVHEGDILYTGDSISRVDVIQFALVSQRLQHCLARSDRVRCRNLSGYTVPPAGVCAEVGHVRDWPLNSYVRRSV